jgi:hypothetical protein
VEFAGRDFNQFDLACPDGTAYAPVSGEDFDEVLGPVALSAFDLFEDPVPGFIEKAQRHPSQPLIERQRESETRPFDVVRLAYAAGLARTGSNLGYATRIAEFERLAQRDYNLHLEEFMGQAETQSSSSVDWFAAVCATAYLLMSAAHKEPYSPDSARLLSPVGVGHGAHRDLCSWELTARISGPEAEEAMNEISGHELADCWGYRYYLRACEMSLPPDARAALAG